MNESEKELERKLLMRLYQEGCGTVILDSSDISIPNLLMASGKENTAENRNNLRYQIVRLKNLQGIAKAVVIDEEFLTYQMEGKSASSWLLGERGVMPGFTLNWEENVGMSEFDKAELITDLSQKLKRLSEGYFIKFIRLVIKIDISNSGQSFPEDLFKKFAELVRIGYKVQSLGMTPMFSLRVGNITGNHSDKHLFWQKAIAYFVKQLQDSELVLEGIALGLELLGASALQRINGASLSSIQRDSIRNYVTLIRTVPIAIRTVMIETDDQCYSAESFKTLCMMINAIFRSELQMPYKISFSFGAMLYGVAIANLKENPEKYYFAYQQMIQKRADDINVSLKGNYKESDEGLVYGTGGISIVTVGTL